MFSNKNKDARKELSAHYLAVNLDALLREVSLIESLSDFEREVLLKGMHSSYTLRKSILNEKQIKSFLEDSLEHLNAFIVLARRGLL